MDGRFASFLYIGAPPQTYNDLGSNLSLGPLAQRSLFPMLGHAKVNWQTWSQLSFSCVHVGMIKAALTRRSQPQFFDSLLTMED
jgi:hypothetical protein